MAERSERLCDMFSIFALQARRERRIQCNCLRVRCRGKCRRNSYRHPRAAVAVASPGSRDRKEGVPIYVTPHTGPDTKLTLTINQAAGPPSARRGAGGTTVARTRLTSRRTHKERCRAHPHAADGATPHPRSREPATAERDRQTLRERHVARRGHGLRVRLLTSHLRFRLQHC